MTAAPLRGAVYMVEWDDDEGNPLGPKPVLVISNNVRNRVRPDVLVVRITTTGKHSNLPTVVELVRGDPFVGWVLCDEILTLYKDSLTDPKPGLTAPSMARVADGLRSALGI